MIMFKRTLLGVLILITSVTIALQLYKILMPQNNLDPDVKYVQLVDQYRVLKMERVVLEEQYALARTKAKIVSLAASIQRKQPESLGLSKHFSLMKAEEPPKLPITLSHKEAETYEKLEAYMNSNKPNKLPALTSDEKNLLAAPAEDFTLQLIGVRDPNELTRFIKDNQVPDAQVFHTYYLNQDWYVLVSGRYKNHTEALKAMESLPATIKDLKPWIRQLITIQKAIQLYR